MAKKFANELQAKRERGAALKEALRSSSLTANSLAKAMYASLDMAEASVRSALYAMVGGHRLLTQRFANAAVEHLLGVTAEALLIKPVGDETWAEGDTTGEAGTGTTDTSATTTRKSRTTSRFLQLLKDQQLSVADVVAKIEGDATVEEELADASQNVGEVSKPTWKKIQQAYGLKPKKKIVRSSPKKATADKPSGTMQVCLEVNRDAFSRLFTGQILVTRQGDDLVITTSVVITTKEFFDLF